MNAIETTYKGYKFRSRLEAKWASVFDQLGWEWEYEPVDLDGYIPDFLLLFPWKDVLCEIKPATTIDDALLASQKIELSGWDGEAIILGSGIHKRIFGWLDETIIGVIAERTGPESGRTNEPDGWWWDRCVLCRCKQCNRPSIHHYNGWWGCRVCGQYEGNQDLGEFAPERFEGMWAQAHNETKWRRPR